MRWINVDSTFIQRCDQWLHLLTPKIVQLTGKVTFNPSVTLKSRAYRTKLFVRSSVSVTKITLNNPKSAAMGFFSKVLKNEFETVVVNEPSVFEPLKVYCIVENAIKLHVVYAFVPCCTLRYIVVSYAVCGSSCDRPRHLCE